MGILHWLPCPPCLIILSTTGSRSCLNNQRNILHLYLAPLPSQPSSICVCSSCQRIGLAVAVSFAKFPCNETTSCWSVNWTSRTASHSWMNWRASTIHQFLANAFLLQHKRLLMEKKQGRPFTSIKGFPCCAWWMVPVLDETHGPCVAPDMVAAGTAAAAASPPHYHGTATARWRGPFTWPDWHDDRPPNSTVAPHYGIGALRTMARVHI